MTVNSTIDQLKLLLDQWKSGFFSRVEAGKSRKESGSDPKVESLGDWGNLERDLELVCNQLSKPAEGWLEVLSVAGELAKENAAESHLFDPILAPLSRSAGIVSRSGEMDEEMQPALIEKALHLYEALPGDSISRNYLLAFLAWQSGRNGLSKVVHCLANDPPKCAKGIPVLFTPLIKREDIEVDWIFPDIFAGIPQLDLGTAIIDYANYLFRQKGVRPHPASLRLEPLAQLLATATQQLLKIEQDPASLGADAQKVSQVINDSVGLITALCDALALNGDKSIVGKIYPALEVTHRRVKLEAAAALARLGEEDGKDQLIELAEQSVVRRRVIEYAKEIGIEDKIDSKYKTPEAIAETELALWLAHPSQMGVAPYKMEVVDSRTQFWPGYEQPVECFLLKYIYPFQPHAYENVGLVGPITHSFSSSIINLPPEDVYAVFAGWHVQHEEIFAGPVSDASIHQQGMLSQLRRRISDQKLTVESEKLLGSCLGEWALICRGSQDVQGDGPDGESSADSGDAGSEDQQNDARGGWIVADLEHCFWLPDDAGFESFDENFAWYLYLGRKLLTEFNGQPS